MVPFAGLLAALEQIADPRRRQGRRYPLAHLLLFSVLALVERGGKVRTFHINSVTKEEIGRIVRENVAREAWLMTDEAKHYTRLGEGNCSSSR